MSFIGQLLISVLMSMAGKLLTRAYVERVLSAVVVLGLGKLASMTTNTVDDDLVMDAAKRLNVKSPGASDADKR